MIHTCNTGSLFYKCTSKCHGSSQEINEPLPAYQDGDLIFQFDGSKKKKKNI